MLRKIHFYFSIPLTVDFLELLLIRRTDRVDGVNKQASTTIYIFNERLRKGTVLRETKQFPRKRQTGNCPGNVPHSFPKGCNTAA